MINIIVVEDDPMIAEIYQKKFSESGFSVQMASFGEQVLKMAKEGKTDVILLDIMMPKMDGFETTAKLRSKEYNQNIKIIMFTNLSKAENMDKALKAGADGYVVKAEYGPTELVEEVKRLASQKKGQRKSEAKIDNKEISEDSNGGKGKILMVEDEKIFTEMFGEKLKQDGFEVVFAENGAWGLKEALDGDYDLFIIDMFMPAMTGLEIVSKLKLEEKTKNKPIIILSASVEDEDVKKVKALGISEFILKTQIIPSELSKKASTLIKK